MIPFYQVLLQVHCKWTMETFNCFTSRKGWQGKR